MLICYEESLKNFRFGGEAPLYLRSLIKPRILRDVFSPRTCTIEPHEIMAVDHFAWNGNISVTCVDGRRFWAMPEDGWEVHGYSPTGELIEIIKPGEDSNAARYCTV